MFFFASIQFVSIVLFPLCDTEKLSILPSSPKTRCCYITLVLLAVCCNFGGSAIVNCVWERNLGCGGQLLTCTGRGRYGLPANNADEAAEIEKRVRIHYKNLGLPFGKIKNSFTGTCKPGWSPFTHGQINCKTKLFAANMENIFYKHDETLCSGGSRMKLEAAIKKLPRNAVVYYPRGGQFIQWPTFGGHVTEEWLAKNRCPGEQAPLCGTPLVISADDKIPNSFPATELFIITRLEGGAIRKEGQLGNVIALQRCDQKARENALLKKRVEVLEKKIHQLESGPAGVQKDQEVKISHLNEMQ
ncbi:hypothetical protein B9Z55_023403 [Caenorhabditis nigoni]|uniref:C-type lectin domain-containing protein n=1 Tax=Caenorhabditis nigoni TaxID=1611254 RepID=A0A2G5SQ07_9PELO|nr:hypothetical protein B9Z55_023403 [Caenorhabditis nigoni]